ncbi:MAG: acyl transferase [Chitinophagales bacterium]|jgi:hypothetical protein|nr:acyl transferase [Sphingobacteriales bacterium]
MQIDLAEINDENFKRKALDVFRYQRENNPIYGEYSAALLKREVHDFKDIPFLPISFFKSHQVSCFPNSEMNYFESSGTIGQSNSRHYYENLDLYHQSIELGFKYFFKDRKYTIVGLLPHYLERQHSSLVAMVRHWMKMNEQEEYFYLHNLLELNTKLIELLTAGKQVLLIGISFALLDFSEIFKIQNSLLVQTRKLSIIETGGMKGSRPELPKHELVSTLKQAFPQSTIISEYGMCELFSQAYSNEDLWFSCPPWMKVQVADINDPLSNLEQGRGVAKIIDLANLNSCSFIETQDLVELRADGRFQILGRMNQSDMRGCSLMYS